MGGCSSGFRNRFPFHRVPDMNGDGIRSDSSLSLSLFFEFGLGFGNRDNCRSNWDFLEQCRILDLSLVCSILLERGSLFIIS